MRSQVQYIGTIALVDVQQVPHW